MDLHTLEAYLQPSTLQQVPDWQSDWQWLAGGTWLFSEPQPQVKQLVDLALFDWTEIEEDERGVTIGATCSLAKLAEQSWPAKWPALLGFQGAIAALAASFKVVNMATIGGNLCLALSISTLAPLMVALEAIYEIWHPKNSPRWVSAIDFQTGVQQTILQPGEVMRRIFLPAEVLTRQVSYQRLGQHASDPALVLVAAIYDPTTTQTQFGVGACTPAPRFIQFSQWPDQFKLEEQLQQILPVADCISDFRAGADYRQQMAKVLMQRALRAFQPD